MVLSFIEAGFEEQKSLSGMVLVLWLEIGVYIFVGVKGNEWCVRNLQKRGFQLVETLRAETPDEAIGKMSKVS